MSAYLDQLRSFWTGLDARRQRMLVGALAVAALTVLAVGAWSTHVPYATLSASNSYDDALTVASALDEAEIPYRIDGSTVEVPSGRLGAAQAAVRSIQGGPSLVDASDLSPTLTPRAMEWALVQQLRGELQRAIANMQGIASATVFIAPREASPFLDDGRPATASVGLVLERGQSLAPGQVRAVAALVAQAVEGLDADRVTITDNRGHLLAAGTERSQEGMSGELVEMQAAVEGRLERNVLHALLPVLGSGSAFSVVARVDLDPTQVETRKVDLDVERPAVGVEEIDESTTEKATQGGVPGVDANLPERAQPNAAADAQSSDRFTTRTQYTYPSTETTESRPAGELRRVSVAVQVDQARLLELAAVAAGEEGDVAAEAEALREHIDSAVRTAVGADEARGDSVVLSVLPFSSAEVELAEASTLPPAVQSVLPYAVATLALLLAFLFVVRPLVAAAIAPQEEEAEGAEADEAGDPSAPAAPDEEPASLIATRLRLLVDNFQPVDASDLNQLVEKEAETAAQVLRLWNRSS